jgi:hypothetical protein
VSRKPSYKPRPKPGATVITGTKKKAAIGQLDSAIFLWFNERDPISTIVLANNAHDCYHALGTKVGKSSVWEELLQKMPKSVRERHKYIPDFAKHGFKDVDEDVQFAPNVADAIMVLAVECHGELYGTLTPLMGLFLARMFHEQPAWLNASAFSKIIENRLAFNEVGKGSRKDCFEKFLPDLRTFVDF